jgi:hypothetical protein
MDYFSVLMHMFRDLACKLDDESCWSCHIVFWAEDISYLQDHPHVKHQNSLVMYLQLAAQNATNRIVYM